MALSISLLAAGDAAAFKSAALDRPQLGLRRLTGKAGSAG